MSEIKNGSSDIERIKALYESGEGLHDPGQMYAHMLIVLAELDRTAGYDTLIEDAERFRALARSMKDERDQLRAQERERILGTPDEPTGILDRYEVKADVAPNGKPLHFVYCGRCHHIQITARDLEGDQSGVTLAELAEWAMDHEEEVHPEPAESSTPEPAEVAAVEH